MRALMKQPLIRLFVTNGILGIGFGLAIAATLVAVDFRGVATLALTDPDGFVAVILLAFGLSVTCGGAAIATAVMLLPWEDEEDGDGPRGGSGGGGGGNERFDTTALRPIPVRVQARGRHGVPRIPRDG
ncbi:hypothetical protein [Salinarimonas ramus]|uniref:Uncharacterized protein n=1 Tax=Salinarimonas ramus TaxID=690164 RepID=A0A917Q9X1_9HYPH|nr:hypothetical protein [Salinarimonas ramus]GGK35067.1 hypothetical protein GCM10011322_22310 [Salinarimonas ramus]